MNIFLRVFKSVGRVVFSKVTLGVLLIAAIGGSGYLYVRYQNTQLQLEELKKDPKSIALEETKNIVSSVSAHMSLPQGEEPVIATVKDINKLKSQAFFKNAKNGDRVLIYTEAKRAILYRPSTDKIIEVAPVNVGNQSEKLSIAVYNGSTVSTMSSEVQTKLKKAFPKVEFTFAKNQDAKKKTYASTLVIDVSTKHSQEAATIAKALGATVGKLPAGEVAATGVDLMIIAGGNGLLTPTTAITTQPETASPSAAVE
jgi:LytR cell envelope-related transcriptional attenuator